jgi:hypothetical protein
MDLKQEIKNGFDIFVKTKFQNEDIRNFLLNHERRSLLESNLLRELKRSYHIIKEFKTIEKMIKDFSHMFCKAALDAKEIELKKSFKPTIIKAHVD